MLQVLIGLRAALLMTIPKCKWLLKQLKGIAHFDSGLAAKRAIQDRQEPRRVALTWFKSQMNLLPHCAGKISTTLFGMTPFHSAVMLVYSYLVLWCICVDLRCAELRCSKSLSLLTPQASPTTKFPLLSNPNPAASNVSWHLRKMASQHCHPLPHRARHV